MQKLKALIGYVRFLYHLSFRRNREILRNIAAELSNSKNHEKGKVFVLTVGFSKAGKETFVKNHNRLRHFFRVSSTVIHDMLNKRFSFLQDNNTVEGKAYWEKQFFTRLLRQKVLSSAFERGICVISDSANLKASERKTRLDLAKRYGYKTIILHVECSEAELLQRLRKADDLSEASGGQRVWVDLYQKVQKPRFDTPSSSEADVILHYRSDLNIDANDLVLT